MRPTRDNNPPAIGVQHARATKTATQAALARGQPFMSADSPSTKALVASWTEERSKELLADFENHIAKGERSGMDSEMLQKLRDAVESLKEE